MNFDIESRWGFVSTALIDPDPMPEPEAPMGINNAPIYDWAAWIDIAPSFDWDLLRVVPAEPEPDPEPPGRLTPERTEPSKEIHR